MKEAAVQGWIGRLVLKTQQEQPFRFSICFSSYWNSDLKPESSGITRLPQRRPVSRTSTQEPVIAVIKFQPTLLDSSGNSNYAITEYI